MKETVSTSDQALLEDVRRHRAELRESMNALEDALAAPASTDRSRWAQRVQAALVELAGDFRAHIELTEGPTGLYQELLRTSPRLSGAVEVLTREHLLIDGQIDRLVTRVSAADDLADVVGVRGPGITLLGRLVRHRQRGSDLVFEAYDFDIGGET